MLTRKIIRHTCCRAEDDAGLPFECSCVTEISFKQARELVAAELASWKLQRNANGNIVKNKSAIVPKRAVPPWRLRPHASGVFVGPVVVQLLR